jgi:hypothetical protein
MDSGPKIDQIANDLDELKTLVDEVAEDPPPGVQPKTIGELHDALEKASDVSDDLENEQE